MLDLEQDTTTMLSIQGASLMTGGLMSERKIWQLCKEQQIAYSTENGKIAIELNEMRRLLGRDTAAAA
ncbi:MAG: hypothetical protein SGJ27_26970 [Candidatus Melainabacteria bacterium]|nr:hypothetical protein [Candidatus Melainabacteria bacterium]